MVALPVSLILFGLLGGCLGQSDEPHLIDLTWTMDEGILVYPGHAEYRFDIVLRGDVPAGFYLESNNIFLCEHTGTHIDAPAHFIQGAWRLDQIPLGHMTGPAVVVDVRQKVGNNSDYAISQQDLQDWEREYGRIPDDCILMRWGEKYWDQGALTYLGTETKDPTQLHFPGLHPDGAQWLVDNRKVKMIGIDTMSLDIGQSTTQMAHRIVLPNNVLIIENMAHLDELPPTGSTVYAMPIKIGEGSGAPARVFAIVDNRTSAAGITVPNLIFMLSSAIALICA